MSPESPDARHVNAAHPGEGAEERVAQPSDEALSDRVERHIAIIEDDPIMGESLSQSLGLAGYDVHWFQDGQTALEALPAMAADLVICDIRLPDISGPKVFRKLCERHHAPPFLFMTAYGDIDQAVGLMRAGAGDYITKPFEMEEFLSRIDGLIARRPPRISLATLGPSRPMRALERRLRHYAKADVRRLLISGEAGVGRETAARFAHDLWTQEGQLFLALSCAAYNDEALANALFGEGAYMGNWMGNRNNPTGGTSPGPARASSLGHKGLIERAKGGTLFLGEIEALSPPMQATLLRILEDGVFYHAGAAEPVPFEARLICSCASGLVDDRMGFGFREDLFLALSAVHLSIPPLRERPEDIPWLLQRCLDECASRVSMELKGISEAAEEAALAHDWPGNVRELRNRVERAVYLSESGWIMPADLFPERGRSAWEGASEVGSLARVREAAERRQIARALAFYEGHVSKAAQALGISRTTLWEKMRKYGLKSQQ